MICLLGLFSSPLISKEISVFLAGNTTVNADYRPGQQGKPAVFLLHGFMSTYNLNIIQIIAEELEGEGYTVLAPTLSLNINNRRAGINCDAVHTHTMESDVSEIAWWVNWLKSKGYRRIVMLGFSTGALQISVYLSKQQDDSIEQAILLSPAYLAGKPFPEQRERKDIAEAKKMLTNHKDELQKFSLSYCKSNFLSPPNVFLSYKHWTSDKLLKVIERISIPTSIFLGSNDHRFGPYLNAKLTSTKSKVITIPGANHFFDSPYEFQLLENINNALARK